MPIIGIGGKSVVVNKSNARDAHLKAYNNSLNLLGQGRGGLRTFITHRP